MVAEKIYKLRNDKKMTQDELAALTGVSRQSVQKWETGKALPTSDKLLKLSEIFNVTIDYLCKDIAGDPERVAEESGFLASCAKYSARYGDALGIEYRQCEDEGKDVKPYKELFEAVEKMPKNAYRAKIADCLFEMISGLPVKSDFPFSEPTDLERIKELRVQPADLEEKLKKPEKNVIADKMKGGWFGRICGCLLGKPIEGISLAELNLFLKRTGNYPLSRYVTKEEAEAVKTDDITFPVAHRAYSQNFRAMPADDDTNYMLIAYETLNRFGRDFSSDNIGEVWLTTQTHEAYFTAEYVAYTNLLGGCTAQTSGVYQNPYREFIGAQIRADVFGYVNPANPEAAAKMAWKDATVSHVKNGVYGEMWVAAMLAAAYSLNNVKEIIAAGLAQIPATSRIYKAVSDIVKAYDSGVTCKDCFNDIISRWNEKDLYEWCHVISNAEIVTASLLYGGGDYGKSICLAVGTGFDTDCNGATVGSVIGVMKGYSALPQEWVSRIDDTLLSTVKGYEKVSVSEMAEKTLKFVE